MHARPPAQNVILERRKQSAQYLVHPPDTPAHSRYAQVRVHPRHLRIRHRLREWAEPPLRLPLRRVLAPQLRVPVARADADDDRRALRHEDLLDVGAVDAANGVREGHRDVFAGSVGDATSVSEQQKSKKAMERGARTLS